ncbi:MAG: hypothetical protein RR135_05480 [Oscillospiraceae bacterium]
MKKYIAVMLALAIVFSTSLVAFAASDYSEEAPKPGDSIATGGTTGAGASAMQPAGVVAGAQLEIGKTDTIYITQGATIDKAAIEKIKNGKTPITFVSQSYTITLTPGAISAPKDLSLGLVLASNNGMLEIFPVSKGDFGLFMTITIMADELRNMVNPHLYYFGDDGKIVDYGLVTVKGNKATISISHASGYIITDKVISGSVAGVMTPTTTTNTTTGPHYNPATGVSA